jgi:transposase
VAKYAYGLPLYRKEAIYACDGVDLDRSLMAQWMGKDDDVLVVPLFVKSLETLEVGSRNRCDTGELFARSR